MCSVGGRRIYLLYWGVSVESLELPPLPQKRQITDKPEVNPTEDSGKVVRDGRGCSPPPSSKLLKASNNMCNMLAIMITSNRSKNFALCTEGALKRLFST